MRSVDCPVRHVVSRDFSPLAEVRDEKFNSGYLWVLIVVRVRVPGLFESRLGPDIDKFSSAQLSVLTARSGHLF